MVHYTRSSPGHVIRTPFMAKGDAKFSTWTHELHRGKGLSTFAAKTLMKDFENGNFYFWWYCNNDNEASKRVAEKLGFAFAGKGMYQEKKFGLSLLRGYSIVESSHD